jgi:hypothetical protein
VVEGHDFADEHQIRLGKERIRAEPLRETLAPGRAPPAEIPDVPAAERRQPFDASGLHLLERVAQRAQRLGVAAEREPRLPDADVAVPAERSLEEEGVVGLLLVEEAEDAERRQQITGKFDGGDGASKACSGKGSAWTGDYGARGSGSR